MANSRTKSGVRFVYNFPSRHGRDRWYFWTGRKGDARHRVKDDVIRGVTFQQAYGRFLQGLHPYDDGPRNILPKQARASQPACKNAYARGTVGWLVHKHLETAAFKAQKNRAAIERQLLWATEQPLVPGKTDTKTVGQMPLDRFNSIAIENLVARKVRKETVTYTVQGKLVCEERTRGKAQSNNIVKWFSAVLRTGIKLGVLRNNAARDVEKQRVGTEGFRMWPDEIWDRVLAAYPAGTKPHLVFHLACYTGQRRGDVTFLGLHQMAPPSREFPDGSLEVVQEKQSRGKASVAHIPIVPELAASIEAARTAGILGSRYFIRQDGKDEPYAKESLGNLVAEWLRDVGIVGYSLHGLRKLCVCRLIERGCAPHEVMAVTGHKTLKEVDRYAAAYFRRKMMGAVYRNWIEHARRLGIVDADRVAA